MKDQTKCFILTPDGYEEITYAELTERRKNDPSYIDKRFIPLHGMLLEVGEDDYRLFYKNKRRQKYISEESARAGEFSYNALDTDEMSGEDILPDNSSSVSEAVTDKLLLEEMLRCFGRMSEDDRTLLTALYFEEKSERTLAKEFGVSQVAVHKRRHKAIARLKEMMEF